MDPLERRLVVSALNLAALIKNRKKGDGKQLKVAFDEFVELAITTKELMVKNQYPALEARLYATMIAAGELIGVIVSNKNTIFLTNAAIVFGLAAETAALYKEYEIFTDGKN